MNNNRPDIEKVLSKISFRKLSNEESARVWDNIAVAQNKPLSFIFNKKNMFKPIIIALILAVAVGSTVAMADNSLPGDTLFGIDRAVENLRLSLASSEKKNELRIAFADERVKEIETIKSSGSSTTGADDKGSSDDLSSNDKIRVSTGINAALVLLNGVSTSMDGESATRLKLITDELNKYLTSLPQDSSVDMKINSEGNKTRVDLQTQDGRIRVEVKNNGEVKIKNGDDKNESDYYKNKSSDDDDSDKGKEDDDEDEGDDDDDDRSNLPPVVITPPSGSVTTAYTMADVKLHNTQSNCWTVVNGSVYNVTSWISKHPGGSSAIVGMCGVDASAAFSGQHGGQSRPASELASFKIGVLK